MPSLRFQQTVGRAVSVSGIGYWSGENVRVEFRPAAVDSGITFIRDDLGSPARIPVRVDHRVDLPRRTSLQVGKVRVDMIEHVMAALSGLQIDNCEVGVTAAEMPGCDGSADAFVAAIKQARPITQQLPIRPLVVRDTVRVGDEDSWVEARPSNRDRLTIEFQLDYGIHRAIGTQSFSIELEPSAFCREIAPARTFVLAEEVAQFLAQGKGTRITARDLLIFGPDGPVENALRFEDECVRHKILDVVGDLALANRPLWGHVVAHRSGHHLNAELVRALLAREQAEAVWRKSA